MDIEQIDKDFDKAIDIACEVSALLSTTADACEKNDLEQEIPLRIAHNKQEDLLELLFKISSSITTKILDFNSK